MTNENEIELLGREALRKLGIAYSNVHLLRLEAEGKFPRRIYLSPARVAWLKAEIVAHVNRCVAARGDHS
jgi:predicted DNA-binding transcriptional regulator AlpA